MSKGRVRNTEIADAFLMDDAYKKTLVFCTGHDMFYLYNDGYYAPLQPDEFEELVFRFVRMRFETLQITTNLIRDLVQQIKWMALRKVSDVSSEYIAFKDGLLNLRTFELEPMDPLVVAIYSMPYYYADVQKAEAPVFNKFLETSLVKEYTQETDEQLVGLVQEMVGFFLDSSMKGAAAFFFVGRGSNGKSVFANVLTALVGRKFVSNMSIQTMTTRDFSLPHIIGKKLNISTEEESRFIRSDKFKALVTGDNMTAEHKFGKQFDFTPTTKYLFLTNDMPVFEGMGYAIERRMKIIPFYRIFTDQESDKNLTEKLLEEIPGIIRWAVEGAQRFISNGYIFTRAESSAQMLKEYTSESLSSVKFIEELYEIREDGFTSNDDLYASYRAWAEKNGRKPLSSGRFLRELTASVEGIESVRGYDEGRTVRGKNLALQSSSSELDDEPLPKDLFNQS